MAKSVLATMACLLALVYKPWYAAGFTLPAVRLLPALRPSAVFVKMAVPSTVDEDTARHMAKKQLRQACEDFRKAQLEVWAAEARQDSGLGKEKDRIGGLFGAESLGTARLQVGELGNKTLALAEKLAAHNPTPEPVVGWKGYGTGEVEGSSCILDGTWKKLFTTAADATFKPSERRGNAIVTQDVNATSGVFTNIIRFDGTENKVREFRVTICGTAEASDTISLDFRRITLLRRSRFPRLFGTVNIYLPPRGFINAIAKWGSRGKADAAPKAEMKLLFVDHELWVHRTGEGNIFVQERMSDFSKPQAQLARDFDRAREETLEIQRIKNGAESSQWCRVGLPFAVARCPNHLADSHSLLPAARLPGPHRLGGPPSYDPSRHHGGTGRCPGLGHRRKRTPGCQRRISRRRARLDAGGGVSAHATHESGQAKCARGQPSAVGHRVRPQQA